MKVALYTRRSKAPKGWRPTFPGQEAPGSVQAQMARLRAWAAAAGHQVVMEQTDTASGRNPNRPGWQAILGAVKGGHVEAVAITKTDRAMRSTKHYLETVELLLARNIYLEVLDQPMACVRGRGDPMAVAFRTVAAAFAQLERDLADERSNEVMEVGEDGRVYGPRSDQPAGRPRLFDPTGHKVRKRGNSLVHVKDRCPACRVQSGGVVGPVSDPPENVGVAYPVGLATPGENAGKVSGVDFRPTETAVVNVDVSPGGQKA